MSEQATWLLLKSKFEGPIGKEVLGGSERITERLNDGVPDVVYQFLSGETGWLELKFLATKGRTWPLVKIPWKSPAQPFWLQRWVRWGGRAGVLLYVADVGWYYWRPSKDIRWVAWAQDPVPAEGATWWCGPRLDVSGLLRAMREKVAAS